MCDSRMGLTDVQCASFLLFVYLLYPEFSSGDGKMHQAHHQPNKGIGPRVSRPRRQKGPAAITPPYMERNAASKESHNHGVKPTGQKDHPGRHSKESDQKPLSLEVNGAAIPPKGLMHMLHLVLLDAKASTTIP